MTAIIIKGRPAVSGGGASEPLDTIKSRILIGWIGASVNSDLGAFQGIASGSSVSTSTPKIGASSLSFNGSQNSALSLRLNEAIRMMPRFSIGFWIRHDSFDFGSIAASWDANGAINGGILIINDSGGTPSNYGFGIGVGDSFYSVNAGEGLITLATWHHVVCEFSRPDRFLKIYTDNILRDSLILPSNIFINVGIDTFSLGGYATGTGGFTNFTGLSAQVFLASGNLSEEERSALWNSGLGVVL